MNSMHILWASILPFLGGGDDALVHLTSCSFFRPCNVCYLPLSASACFLCSSNLHYTAGWYRQNKWKWVLVKCFIYSAKTRFKEQLLPLLLYDVLDCLWLLLPKKQSKTKETKKTKHEKQSKRIQIIAALWYISCFWLFMQCFSCFCNLIRTRRTTTSKPCWPATAEAGKKSKV